MTYEFLNCSHTLNHFCFIIQHFFEHFDFIIVCLFVSSRQNFSDTGKIEYSAVLNSCIRKARALFKLTEFEVAYGRFFRSGK